jgi:hypothetical protein
VLLIGRSWGGVVVKVLCYWSEGPGIDPRWCQWAFICDILQFYKRAITEAAYETIQTQSKKQKNEWWDNDCKLAIREKNEARRIWLQYRTRTCNAWYHKKRNEANRLCTRKKKEWLNNVIRSIEESNKKN